MGKNMLRCALILLILFFSAKSALAVVYECTYKTKNNNIVTSSFNPFHKHKKDYPQLKVALESGNCKELRVKKYLIDATSCNIQFYKYNNKIANVTCAGNKQEPLRKLKEIARRDFGYISK